MTAPLPLTSAPAFPAAVGTSLAQLAVATHKLRAYPEGHPLRQDAVDAAFEGLEALLRDRMSLRIGVMRRQLLVDDAATDPGHFILRDFAARLHRLGVGSLTFYPNLTPVELRLTLERLAVEPGRLEGEALERHLATDTPHVEVNRIAYDALVLDGQARGSAEQSERLWQELAQVLESNAGPAAPEPIVAEDATPAPDLRLRDLLPTLPKETAALLRDLDHGQTGAPGGLTQAADTLPIAALLELVESAAKARKQEVSTLLVRLLRKLARLGSSASYDGARSDVDFRRVIKGLLEDWSLADPNPESHTRLLDIISRRELSSGRNGSPTKDGIRLLQIAIEIDSLGPNVEEAIELAVDSGQYPDALDLFDVAPANSASEAIRRELLSPKYVIRVATDPTADRGPLGKALATAEEPIGAALGDKVARAGTDLQRVFLGFLNQLPAPLPGFSAACYLSSHDPVVRFEAYRLQLRQPSERDAAVAAALVDSDERVARLAVDAALTDGLPRPALTRLLLLLNNRSRSQELRARAVAIMAQFDTPAVRQWLLDGLVLRRGWLRRRRLGAKSPLLLAKLKLLARRWAGHADVDSVVQLARASRDPDWLAAAGAGR